VNSDEIEKVVEVQKIDEPVTQEGVMIRARGPAACS
jgi:hypothetical protein